MTFKLSEEIVANLEHHEDRLVIFLTSTRGGGGRLLEITIPAHLLVHLVWLFRRQFPVLEMFVISKQSAEK